MKEKFLYHALIGVIALISSVHCSTAQECRNQSNHNCKTCLKVPGCAYCKNSKVCYPYRENITNLPCSLSDIQLETCIGR